MASPSETPGRAGNAVPRGQNVNSRATDSHENSRQSSTGQEASSNLSRMFGERLPGFFEIVSDNCRPCLNDLVRYAQVCHLLADADDYEGFVRAGDKLLDQGREFAQFLKLLKKPSIVSGETADRLESEASRLIDRASQLEMKAAHIRAAANGEAGASS